MPTKIFVGNLPDDCSKDTIRDVFGSYGGIDDVAVVKNYAFIHFSNAGDAANAVKDLDGSKISGKTINVEISKKQDNDQGKRDNRDNRDRGRGDRGDRGGLRRGRDGPDRGPGGILGLRPGFGPLGGLGGPLLGLGGPNLNVLGGLGGLVGPGLGGLGNPPLSASLGGASASLGGLGILSAVNTLAAVAEKQQQLNSAQQQRDADVGRREQSRTRDVADVKGLSNNSGYVIYERYYVDPNHVLLKGLPLPELDRTKGSFVGYPEKAAVREDTFASRDPSRTDLDATSRDLDNYRTRSPLTSRREFDNNRWNPASY